MYAPWLQESFGWEARVWSLLIVLFWRTRGNFLCVRRSLAWEMNWSVVHVHNQVSSAEIWGAIRFGRRLVSCDDRIERWAIDRPGSTTRKWGKYAHKVWFFSATSEIDWLFNLASCFLQPGYGGFISDVTLCIHIGSCWMLTRKLFHDRHFTVGKTYTAVVPVSFWLFWNCAWSFGRAWNFCRVERAEMTLAFISTAAGARTCETTQKLIVSYARCRRPL